MDNIPYAEWSDYLCSLLRDYGISSGRLVELGCGTATLANYMSLAGYDVIGIDNSIDMLTIAADINSEKKDNREGYLYSERRTGHVERRFSLEGVREDDITAKCEHGILTVTLPKMQAEAPKAARKIAIASGEEKTDAPAEENK